MTSRIEKLIRWEADHGHAGTSQPERVFLYGLARMYGATRILELGVNTGASLSWLAAAAHDQAEAMTQAGIPAEVRVVGVDNWTGDTGGGGGGSPDKALKRLADLGLSVDIESKSTDDYLDEAVPGSFDLIHVDACHRYDVAVADIRVSIGLEPKVVVVHDVNLGIDDVRRACRDVEFEVAHTGILATWLDGAISGRRHGEGAHGMCIFTRQGDCRDRKTGQEAK
jgi:hypothetical protein